MAKTITGNLIGMVRVAATQYVVPLVDPYGSVLVFKTKEDAFDAGAERVLRLVTAKMPRKLKSK